MNSFYNNNYNNNNNNNHISMINNEEVVNQKNNMEIKVPKPNLNIINQNNSNLSQNVKTYCRRYTDVHANSKTHYGYNLEEPEKLKKEIGQWNDRTNRYFYLKTDNNNLNNPQHKNGYIIYDMKKTNNLNANGNLYSNFNSNPNNMNLNNYNNHFANINLKSDNFNNNNYANIYTNTNSNSNSNHNKNGINKTYSNYGNSINRY
jgi:hypothetical protein